MPPAHRHEVALSTQTGTDPAASAQSDTRLLEFARYGTRTDPRPACRAYIDAIDYSRKMIKPVFTAKVQAATVSNVTLRWLPLSNGPKTGRPTMSFFGLNILHLQDKSGCAGQGPQADQARR
jgi:hypothetical protein